MLTMLIAALLAAPNPTPDAVVGTWRTEVRNGIVAIQRCGPSICGRLVTSDGMKANPALTDANNKDAALRSRPLRGLTILSGFKPSGGGVWSDGTIYNADDGKTYSARLTPEGADRLKVRGCIFVPLCKTQTWTRVR
ncbi:MAG TPA: DUF2147 domain-containing protein [Sphingomonas sp.]|jgi:uncharacterized protein (DUF2147 family)|uniref:DUF2147 domain-containing protein n=1 Tax=Sphingomonas sp. TaxID=28214 RepID=UPI002ED99CB9